MTEAERVFNPGPRWRPMRMWDQMHGMPSTYIKVVAGGTQAFYVPQEEV